MSKKLSKQICEKCGIKPRYGLVINFGDLDNNYQLVTNERKYRLIADYRFEVDSQDELRNLKPMYYPDFGQPENFVKLFTMITTIEDFDFRIGNFYIPYIPSYRQIATLKTDEDEYSSENPNPIKAFLTCVLKCVSKDKDTAEYIREAEWKYE